MGCMASGATLCALDTRLEEHRSSICECFDLLAATSAGGAQAVSLITSQPGKAHNNIDALAEEIRHSVFGQKCGIVLIARQPSRLLEMLSLRGVGPLEDEDEDEEDNLDLLG